MARLERPASTILMTRLLEMKKVMLGATKLIQHNVHFNKGT
jgi:hypothetical protein